MHTEVIAEKKNYWFQAGMQHQTIFITLILRLISIDIDYDSIL